MRVVAAILAAGRGERFGADKTRLPLLGKPVWRWSYDTFAAHPQVDEVLLVGSPANLAELGADGRRAVLGGETRQASTQCALDAAKADILLLHDAARPFVTPSVVSRVIEATRRVGASAPAVAVTDTIKRTTASGLETLDRKGLSAMQTPQGVKTELLRRAFAESSGLHTDDLSLVESLGVVPELVEGDVSNFKITTPEDYERAKHFAGSPPDQTPEIRTGMGYDVHAFSPDPSRALWLGGIHFPNHPGLDGHSDADALLHAITDALLGAAALGDIGVHFPNTDQQWLGAPSLTFLKHAGKLLQDRGWSIINIDSTVIAESPKVMKRALEIRTAIANSLQIDLDRVSLKATTNEQMGFVGRKEGIAATAIATIRKI